MAIKRIPGTAWLARGKPVFSTRTIIKKKGMLITKDVNVSLMGSILIFLEKMRKVAQIISLTMTKIFPLMESEESEWPVRKGSRARMSVPPIAMVRPNHSRRLRVSLRKIILPRIIKIGLLDSRIEASMEVVAWRP